MRHRLLGALVLGVLLTGCSDDPEPRRADPTPTPSASTPVTTEPATDPPSTTATPAPKPESADDFIKRWSIVERDMQNTGNTTEYRTLSPGCRGCDKLATAIEGFYKAGGSVAWDGWKIQRIQTYDRSRTEFLVTVNSSPTRYRKSAGSPTERLNGGPARWVMQLRKEGAGWTVAEKAELVES